MSGTKSKTKKKKGFIISRLKTDDVKCEKGVWDEYADGLMLLIARMDNLEARAYRQKLGLKKKSGRLKSSNSDDLDEHSDEVKAGARVIANTVLLDWKNMLTEEEDGTLTEVPYSKEKAYEYLLAYPEFALDVVAYANDLDNYRLDKKGEAEGN